MVRPERSVSASDFFLLDEEGAPCAAKSASFILQLAADAPRCVVGVVMTSTICLTNTREVPAKTRAGTLTAEKELRGRRETSMKWRESYERKEKEAGREEEEEGAIRNPGLG